MATYDQRNQHVTHQYNAEHITTIQGISEERHERLAEEFGVTRSALTSFFNILEQQQVPPEDLDHTLRQIAMSYKDLHAKLQRFTTDDPVVMALKQQAHDALEAGEFTRAEALLNEASAKDLEAVQQLQGVAHIGNTKLLFMCLHQPVRCLAEVQGVLGHHVPTLTAHRHREPPCSRVTQA
jgi:hypothetical protein